MYLIGIFSYIDSQESNQLYSGESSLRANTVCLSRKATFCASFSKPNKLDPGPGNNYEFEVFIRGKKDPQSGLVINLTEIKKHLSQVIQLVDHKCLDKELPGFDRVDSSFYDLANFLFVSMSKELSNDSQLDSIIFERAILRRGDELEVEVIGQLES